MQQKQTLFTVSHDEQNFGPFSRDEIGEKVRTGKFSLVDFVYDEDRADWITLLEFMPEMESTQPGVKAFDAPWEEKTAVQSRVTLSAGSAPIEVQSETKTGFKLGLTSETNVPSATEVAPAVKSTVLDELKVGSKGDAKQEIKGDSKADGKIDAKIDMKADTKVDTKIDTKIEVKPDTKTDLKTETKSEPKIEAKAEPKFETKGEAKAAASVEKLELQNGVGQFELMQTTAGQMQLRVKLPFGKTLDLPQPLPIVVKPGKAERLSMKGEKECVAGQSFSVTFEAFDKYGNFASDYKGSIGISLSGSAEGAGSVKFENGKAQYSFTNKVAEKVIVKMKGGEAGLDVASSIEVLYKAAPAARLEVVAPTEVVAGQPVSVTVKAFDAFGNLATDLGGLVSLEVEGKKSA